MNLRGLKCFIRRTAMDFSGNKVLTAKCEHGLATNRGLKIVLRDTRDKNSGWSASKFQHENEHANCMYDLGRVSIHRRTNTPLDLSSIDHGKLHTFVITPTIIKSDESIRKIAPKL